MRKKPYLCLDMRYLVVTALALLSWSWAQQYVSPRQTRVFKRNPEIEAITRDAQWVLIDLDEGRPSGIQPQRRITDFGANLGWLKPSQDADTVPTTPNTVDPNITDPFRIYAGDTILANNAGQDIDPNVPSACHHSFFDSLYAAGALGISSGGIMHLGNYLHGNPQRDTVFYIGGGIAERYDITPPTGSSVYIKGIAAIILNNRNSSTAIRCNTSTGEVSGGPWRSDQVYTIGYQLLDTIHITYDVAPLNAPPDLRDGSYPNQVVAEATKPLSQVRIGYNVSNGQCVQQVSNRLERFDHAYFTTPIEITDDANCKKSFYAALRFDLYVPGFDNINDTLFGVFAPYYPNDNDPCLNPDTSFLGRNMLLTPVFRQSTSEFIYPDEWYPQYYLFNVDNTGRGVQLNLAVCPIIYVDQTAGNCLTTSTPVVRNGSMAFSAPYPNPAVDCLHLNVESPAATTLRLTLYTSEGRLVRSWNRTLQSGTNTVAVDLEVPAGAYLLQAQSPYGAATFWVNVVK
jgi:hypothetical protein